MAGSYQYGPGRSNSGPGYHYTKTPKSQRPQKDGGWGEWIGIGILFVIPTWITKVIAAVWAIKKISSMSRQQKTYYRDEARRAAEQVKHDLGQAAQQVRRDVNQAAEHIRRDAAKASGQTASGQTASGQTASGQTAAGQTADRSGEYHYSYRRTDQQGAAKAAGQSQPRGKAAGKKAARVKTGGGNGMIIGGAILSAIFGLGTAATLVDFLEPLTWGGSLFWDELVGVIACGVFLLGGLFMLFSGIGGKRRAERYMNYLAYIGANREVDLAHMAASFDVPVRKLCKDLRRMLSRGILPTGYLDLAEGKLYLTEMGYQAPEAEPEPTPEEARQAAEEREDSILREIRQVNDEIPDEAMSAKIDRIEEITGKILAYQKSHPNKEGQLRSFLNYYLPTTLKVLRAYAQLEAQGIEGENISSAKARIEGMMDQVVAGFEKQLDKLFQDDAMDITSDVQVLENMLKTDGLSDDQGMTMTL